MTILRIMLVATALFGLPSHAAAQDAIRIEPKEAMQCAVWASMMTSSVTDPQAREALNYALSYFIGQYEGASGNSIREAHDEAAITEVVLDPDAFSAICGTHMLGFGPRMVDWGGWLNDLGARIAAQQGAEQGE